MADRSSNLSTLASNIKQGVEARLKDVHTSMPGIIESFDAEKQLSTVQPAIKRIFVTRDGEKETFVASDLPIVINVPVIFPRGGGFSLTFPVKKGDECLLVFCERSIDNWHETGDVEIPGGRRFHSLSDATAFVGLSSLPNKVQAYDDTNVTLGKDDGNARFLIKSDNGIRMENNSGFVELQSDGKLNINGVIFDDHIHDQANDSDGDVQQPTGKPKS